MTRACGGCTLCCKLLPVRTLGKPANTRCQHQRNGKGCAVYHKAAFPAECAIWNCRWLGEADETAGLHRPDRTGYVIDNMPDLIKLSDGEGGEREIPAIQVWVDPARPEAWRDKALWAYAEKQAKDHGEAMLVRFGSGRALAVFAPCFWTDHEWHIVDRSTIVPSRTGSRLLDRMQDQRAR
jgi:hypothetical protein